MVLRRAVDQPNRCAFRCRANVNGERVVVRRAAGKLFQMNSASVTVLGCTACCAKHKCTYLLTYLRPQNSSYAAWSLLLVLTVSRCQRTVDVACQQWQRLPDSRPPSTSAPIRRMYRIGGTVTKDVKLNGAWLCCCWTLSGRNVVDGRQTG